MHIGSVRVALMNFLFARQKNGSFILRVEDTDPLRNFDPGAKKILEDLAWLNLSYDEGPNIGGPYAPYFQSERSDIYKEFLEELKKKNLIYPCFCTQEILEQKRERQKALKLPPRYDKACLELGTEEVKELISKKTPFIWRFKLDDSKIKIFDLAKGEVIFDLKHFSDFALTRPDGSFTFIFANFVDDLTMKVTDVLRGEDHLTNTAFQAVLYKAFDVELPVFCHMPIICNTEGKKLSKRDFGFSLHDLRVSGFLPEAICNYLGIIGASFKNEIMDLDELVKEIDFKAVASASQIRYDVEKLRWINHKWIMRLSISDFAERCRVYLEKYFEDAKNISKHDLENLLSHVRSDLVTLQDVGEVLKYYFERPEISAGLLKQFDPKLPVIISEAIVEFKDDFSADKVIEKLKILSKETNIPLKDIFKLIRIALTGAGSGIGIKELLITLPKEEIYIRLSELFQN